MLQVEKVNGSSQSSTTTITSIECSSISSGINLINSYISKQVNLSHCKVVVISEELASDGIAESIYTLVDNVEIRPDCNVIVSRCDALDFLEKAKPTLEKLTARYYEAAIKSSKYIAYTADIQMNDFYSALKNFGRQPVAILAGINTSATHSQNKNISKFNVDSSYKADETPIQNKTNLECMGLAVFREDKLVGELNGIESVCYSILTNILDNCMVTIPNPDSPENSLDIYLSPLRKTKVSVEMVNNMPFISIQAYLEGYVSSSSSANEHSTNEILQTIGKATEDYLESQISSFAYKTAKDLKCDIVGFGKYVIPKYLTWDEWVNSNWLSNYQNSFFNIDVFVNINSGELFSKM